jgi:photosynthetic reaction center cytochrome c subunit
MESVQLGPNGAAIGQVTNPRLQKAVVAPPPSAYTVETREGQRAKEVYPDLKVLGDVSIDEFNLTMLNITAWIAPAEEGCNYCHNPENMASYEKYTKTVALSMLKMTININSKWQSHVKQTGVTCYTCHAGKAIPANVWYNQPPEPANLRGNRHNQMNPLPVTAFSSLPNRPFETFLAGDGQQIRVGTPQIHPTGGPLVPIQNAEHTWGLMMHMSTALGVNCTFCHNTQNFSGWSREQRVGAWYGIRMVREANNDYITPLKGVFPVNAGRLGPMGDPLKVNCTTCHQGLNKPLGGVSMLKDNPALAGPAPGTAPLEAPATAAVDAAALMTGSAASSEAAPGA